MKQTWRAVLPLLLVMPVLMAACSGATPKTAEPEPEPELPPLTPKQRLIGTWKTTDIDFWEQNEDGSWDKTGFIHETLTFTGERWVGFREHFAFDGTTVLEPWGSSSGGWSADDETITKRERKEEAIVTTEKSYLFAEDGRLILEFWDDDAEVLTIYQRVEDAAPDIVGTWERVPRDDEDTLRWTFTLRADGTFRYQAVSPGRWDYILVGNYEHDADLYYIHASDLSATDRGEDAPPREGPWRWAYAPTGDDRILISWWAHEPGQPDLPMPAFGQYSHIIAKQ